MPSSEPKRRKRSLPTKGPDFFYLKKTYFPATGVTIPESGRLTWSQTLEKRWRGTQETVSETHPSWRKRSKRSFQDVGGEFFSQRRYVESKISSKNLIGKSGTANQKVTTVYSGPVLASAVTSGSTPFPPYIGSSNAALDAWGAKAIAICKPTNAVADASVFLGELLREGLPNMASTFYKQGVKRALDAPGSAYLSYEFGWKPIVRDVRKFAYAVNHADTVLAQFERDSGKMVRRRFEFQPEQSTSEVVYQDGVDPYYGFALAVHIPGSVPSGKVIRRRETVVRRWFSGAFTYWVPSDSTSRGALAKHASDAKKLLGISLTPDVVWNLSPWSWAVDWFSSAGDVISNLTDWAFDGLVLRYGYIMEHSSVKDTYIFVGPTTFQSQAVRPDSVTFVSETKIRRKANPFGFGITWSGLSPRQLAIAAALGLTRS